MEGGAHHVPDTVGADLEMITTGWLLPPPMCLLAWNPFLNSVLAPHLPTLPDGTVSWQYLCFFVVVVNLFFF